MNLSSGEPLVPTIVQAVWPAPPPRTRADVLADHRRHCQDLEGKGWSHLDEMVFKVSAGGLAISVTLLSVTEAVAAASMGWIYGAWALWAVSLLALMVSICTGQAGLRSQIHHIDHAASLSDSSAPSR